MVKSLNSSIESLEILKSTVDIATISEASRSDQTRDATLEESKSVEITTSVNERKLLLAETIKNVVKKVEEAFSFMGTSIQNTKSNISDATSNFERTIKSSVSDINTSFDRTKTSLDLLKSSSIELQQSQTISVDTVKKMNESISNMVSFIENTKSALNTISTTSQFKLTEESQAESNIDTENVNTSVVSLVSSIDEIKSSLEILKSSTDSVSTNQIVSADTAKLVSDTISKLSSVFEESKISLQTLNTATDTETESNKSNTITMQNMVDSMNQTRISFENLKSVAEEVQSKEELSSETLLSMTTNIKELLSSIERFKSSNNFTEESSELTEKTLLSSESSQDVKMSIIDLVKKVEELGLSTPSTLAANAAMEKLAQEATQPGSIYTHDMSSESLLKNIFELLQKWFDTDKTFKSETKEREEVSSAIEKESKELLQEQSETEKSSLEIQKSEKDSSSQVVKAGILGGLVGAIKGFSLSNVVSSIGTLASKGFGLFMQTVMFFKDTVGLVFKGMGNGFMSMIEFIKDKFSLLYKTGQDAFVGIKEKFFGVIAYAKKAFGFLKDKIFGIFKNPRESFGKMLTSLKEGFTRGIKAIRERGAKGLLSSAKEGVLGAGKTVKDRISGLFFRKEEAAEEQATAQEKKPTPAMKKGIMSRIGDGVGSIGRGIGSVGRGIAGIGKGLGSGLTFIAKGIGSFGNVRVIKGAFALLLVATAMMPFAKAMGILADLPVTGILSGLAAISGVGLVLFGLSKIGGSIIKGAVALAIAGVAMLPIAYAFSVFSGIDAGTIAGALLAVTGIAAVATILGLIATSGVGAAAILLGAGLLAVIGAAFIPFAYSLSLLEGIDVGVLEALGPALLSMLPGLIGMALISPLLPLVGAGMLLLGAGLALMSLGDPDTISEIGSALWNLILPLTALSAISFLLPSVGAGMLLIGAGLALMSLVDTEKMSKLSGVLKDLLLPLAVYGALAPLMLLSGAALASIGLGMMPIAVASNLVSAEGLEAFTMLIQTLAGSAGMLIVAALGLVGVGLGIGFLAASIIAANAALAMADVVGDIASWLGFDPGPGIIGTILSLAGASDKLIVTANALGAIASALERIGSAMGSLNDSEMALETIDTLVSLDATQIQTLQDVSIAMDRVMSANEKLKEEKQVQQMSGAQSGAASVNTIVNSSNVGGSSVLLPSPSGRNSDPSIMFSAGRYYSMIYR